HTADLKPERIAEFLLLNAEFPHSIRFSVDALQTSLHAISEHAPPRKGAHLERLAGRLRATLSYSPIEEIMFGGLHSYLENIRRQCAQIHGALFEVYITYAIESALEA
ncbi:MAG TPA: hypothetical protein DEH78_22395, partial [Solibacterales bacterium]|nr:hypothetical protein [Bryobacterales bacterium]